MALLSKEELEVYAINLRKENVHILQSFWNMVMEFHVCTPFVVSLKSAILAGMTWMLV